ncbi:MAG: hypothetical protein ACLTXT_03570 [Ruminococcus callidus]
MHAQIHPGKAITAAIPSAVSPNQSGSVARNTVATAKELEV